MIQIIARPRLHISLADMGFASLRSFGGIGFSVESPVTVIEFQDHCGMDIQGLEQLDDEARSDVNELVCRMKSINDKLAFRAILKSSPPQHVGFGSKTSLALSLVVGVNVLCGARWSIDEMQRLSGRGGASGVGVHAFFHGGCIWDAGHSMHAETRLTPSGSAYAAEVPPLMLRLTFPEIWEVVLLLPSEAAMSGKDEISFFELNTPVPVSEALATLAALYHGVLPAVKCADYRALTLALIELHRVGFKQRELRRCDAGTAECVHTLHDNGIAAGLSSVGPLIYAIVPRDDPGAHSRVRNSCAKLSLRLFSTVRPWNYGYEIWPGKSQ